MTRFETLVDRSLADPFSWTTSFYGDAQGVSGQALTFEGLPGIRRPDFLYSFCGQWSESVDAGLAPASHVVEVRAQILGLTWGQSSQRQLADLRCDSNRSAEGSEDLPTDVTEDQAGQFEVEVGSPTKGGEVTEGKSDFDSGSQSMRSGACSVSRRSALDGWDAIWVWGAAVAAFLSLSMRLSRRRHAFRDDSIGPGLPVRSMRWRMRHEAIRRVGRCCV